MFFEIESSEDAMCQKYNDAVRDYERESSSMTQCEEIPWNNHAEITIVRRRGAVTGVLPRTRPTHANPARAESDRVESVTPRE